MRARRLYSTHSTPRYRPHPELLSPQKMGTEGEAFLAQIFCCVLNDATNSVERKMEDRACPDMKNW